MDDIELLATRIMGWEWRDPPCAWYDGEGWWPNWTPRTNWDHAGMLVERLAEMGWTVVISNAFGNRLSDEAWRAYYGNHSVAVNWIEHYANAPTGPAAITEAALALAREMNDDSGGE